MAEGAGSALFGGRSTSLGGTSRAGGTTGSGGTGVAGGTSGSRTSGFGGGSVTVFATGGIAFSAGAGSRSGFPVSLSGRLRRLSSIASWSFKVSSR